MTILSWRVPWLGRQSSPGGWVLARPSILKRFALARQVFSLGLPSPYQRKVSPLAWPAWREGKPEWFLIDYQGYINEGYNLNSLIYSAIAYKARAVTAAPLRAYVGDAKQPELLPPTDPLSKLLARPNPAMSGAEMMQLLTVYLNLAGNAYVQVDRPGRGGFPLAMRPLRPDRIFIIPENKTLRGYLYVPEGQSRLDGVPILPADMIHVKLPNPSDPLEGLGYGMSSLSPMAQSADVDNQVTRYLKTFFEKGTMNNLILKFNVPMDDAQIAHIRKRWAEVYGGVDNWGEVGVLDQSGEVQRLGLTFDEMGFAAIDERNEARILGPFGVPPILIGSRMGLARATYANYETARRAFWEDTFVPELQLFESEFDYYLAPEEDRYIRFDTSQVPALREDVYKQVDSATKLFGMGVPANQALRIVGLDVETAVPSGDTGYLPLNLVPVGLPRLAPAPPVANPPPANENPAKPIKPIAGEATAAGQTDADRETRKSAPANKAGLSDEAKSAHWKATDGIAQSWEGKFADAAGECLERDRREILALVGQGKALALRFKATLDWSNLLTNVNAYLEGDGAKAWRQTFVPMFRGVITDQGQHIETAFGLRFDVRNLLAEQWFEEYQLKFAQPINQTTSDGISETLQQGQRDGWSIDELSKRLNTQFKGWLGGDLTDEERAWFEDRIPRARRDLIGRTESMRAANAGSQAIYEDAGVKRHEWLATMDNRVRDSHAAVNGQVQPIDQPFNVGGNKMMYPGDPSAPVEEVANCRCTVLPVMEGAE